MIQVPRDDRSLIGQWWWTVDRWALGAVLAIMAFGVMLTLAASPPAAERIGADPSMFAKRQFVFLPMALALMLAISLASPRHVRRLALLVFCGSVLLLAAHLRGRRRDQGRAALDLGSRPVERAAVGVREAQPRRDLRLAAGAEPRRAAGAGLFPLDPAGRRRAGAADLQPDLGMSIVVALVWAAQLFVVGLPMWVAGFGVVGGAAAIVGAYFTFSHVRSRFDRFLDPSSGDNYQVNTALEAFQNGGAVRPRAGRGHGQGAAARRPYRLRLGGGRRGVRPDRLPDDPRPVRLRRPCGRCRAPRRRPACSSPLRRPGSACSSACRRRSTWPRPSSSSRPRA